MTRIDFPAGECSGPVVVGIGVFDGVHLGHRKIIAELTKMGRRFDAVPVALTFFPHPRAVLCPASPPRLLLPPEERLKRLRDAGAAGVGVVNFTMETAETTPENFLDRLLAVNPRIRGICVGSRWKFGRNGSGDAEYLRNVLPDRGLAFEAVPELVISGGIVSSSAIRDAVAAGKLDAAAKMLGTSPMLFGEVEHGFGEAATLLQAPTANLRVDFGVLPPNGVYASRAVIDGKHLPALTNIGISPTFNRGEGAQRRVETYVMDFSGDIYRRKIGLELVARLRPELTFPSAEALKRQILEDRKTAMDILARDDIS